jgi:maleylacetoacetate isomerase
MLLYDYFRSTSSYRVRIALSIKALDYQICHIDLLAGDHKSKEYVEKNPQGFVPMLEEDGHYLTQSLAIIEYLDESFPSPPLLFGTPSEKAFIRQLALIIACDTHPLNNPKVWKQYVGKTLGASEEQMTAWYQHWVVEGLRAYESFLDKSGASEKFSCGNRVSLADICLIPQLYNARRFDVCLSDFPRILKIEANCLGIEAFKIASPEAHPDAPEGLEQIHGPNSPLLRKAA